MVKPARKHSLKKSGRVSQRKRLKQDGAKSSGAQLGVVSRSVCKHTLLSSNESFGVGCAVEMNRSVLRNLAAATAVICNHRGGSVGMFFLMKALYLADREMMADYGSPITGDLFSSMQKGPMLSGLYDLLRRSPKLGDAKAQAEWDSAISKNGNMISVRPGKQINTECLSPLEEKILREKIDQIMDLDSKGVNIAQWMHKHCPEWEEVGAGSKPLPVKRVLMHSRKMSEDQAASEEQAVRFGIESRQGNLLSASPLLR